MTRDTTDEGGARKRGAARPAPAPLPGPGELFATAKPAPPRRAARRVAPPRALAAVLAEVCLPVPLSECFHYRIAEVDLERVQPGTRVKVPFGHRSHIGVVAGLVPLSQSAVPIERLKPIERVLDDEPALTPDLLALCRFVASYYRSSLGEACAAALPGAVKRRGRLRGGPGDPARSARGASAGGAAAPLADDASVDDASADAPSAPLALTSAQTLALAPILDDLRAERFGVTLLHGVTGSGKTEVYLHACAEAIARGRQALVLVPEIALTPQTVRRFEARLGSVAVLHSMLGDAERARAWERMRRGEVAVAVGPRSAIFAPLTRLGLVIVDEEHEPSFKQQDTSPRYHARDLAVWRARQAGAPCVLGSATPSLESLENARRGRYRRVTLAGRPGGARLPEVIVVDLREESREQKGFPLVSRTLQGLLGAAFDRGEQAILFLNRRGFSTFLSCPRCGNVLGCKQCDVALTYHKARGRAVCHGCDVSEPPPTKCPSCGHAQVTYFGFGTERIQQEIERRFPDAVVKRLDSDAVKSQEDLQATLGSFARGEAQVLVGTQMVAKGLDFPNVSVVGVISADSALNLPDFRAAERTFQLTAQVAGRSGRGVRAGVTVIQTFAPEHPAITFATRHDADGFAAQELEHRERLGYPPFGRLARAVISATDEQRAHRAAGELAAAARLACTAAGLPEERVRVLGPAPCPVAQLRGRYRIMVLLKATDREALAPALAALEAPPFSDRQVRVAIDIDPVSML